MASPGLIILGLLALNAPLAFAQSGVLVNGNSNLPSCAQSCTLLNQAAEACGGTTSADQAIWSCFCQSAYLSNLRSSDTGICSDVCTDTTDSQQVSTWYSSNCGTDDGASEHTALTAIISAVATATSTAAAAGASSTAASTSSGSSTSSAGHTWWDKHWRWIVMLIVLALGLVALAFLLKWLKKRHRAKRDQISGGFNPGITTRHAPTGPSSASRSGIVEDAPRGDRVNSSVRTRDAFMPYGYGYTRSESRLGYQAERGSQYMSGGASRGNGEKFGAVDDVRAISPEPNYGRNTSARRGLVHDRAPRDFTAPAEPNEKLIGR